MRRSITLTLACLSFSIAGLAPASSRADEPVVMSYPYFPGPATHRVVKVDAATREVIVAPADGPGFFMTSEGPAILAVSSRTGASPDTAVRLEIEEVLDDGSVRGTFGPGAAGVVAEGPAFLGRPFAGNVAEMTQPNAGPKPAATKAVRALPDVVRGAKPAEPPPGKVDPITAARAAARRMQSSNNLKQIALAFHNYHDTYGRFPPAAIIGPDGKPWHSWRVLILPFLEEADLHQTYDFSQPWDSPKNMAIMERMPKVFRDPAADAKGSSTHYAVLVGDSTLFAPARNGTMKAADDRNVVGNSGLRIAEVTDGTSNTIMVATVDPARKIPWTKPEDIAVGDDGPSIGTPDGIAALHPAGAGKVGLVAITDGSVRALATTIDPKTLAALATRNGGEVIDQESLGVPGMEEQPGGGMRAMVILRDAAGDYRFEAM